MAALKTQATKASVSQFINAIEDDSRRRDCKELAAMMSKATGAKPVMWGPAIIGFGDHEYTGANGKAVKWFAVGFSPRKAALSVYLMGGSNQELLAKLGPHSCSVSCLYIKSLEVVNKPTLQKLINRSLQDLRRESKK